MGRNTFNPQQGVVLFAKNKKRVSAFYQATLGLRAEESETSHDLLRGDSYEIVVHAIPRKIAAGIAIAKPPIPRDMAVFKPTFVVRSLEGVRIAAEKTGGSLKPASSTWHFRGCAVLDGCDPEGNQVQFKQRDALQAHAAIRIDMNCTRPTCPACGPLSGRKLRRLAAGNLGPSATCCASRNTLCVPT